MDRRIVEKPVISPWISDVCFLIAWVVLFLTAEIGIWWLEVLLVMGAVLVLNFLGKRLDVFLFGKQVIVADNGVETTGRIGAKTTPWNEIIQVGVMHRDWFDVLVLVKKGGRIMKEKTWSEWFALRNTGKLIFLPDDEANREIVLRHYGPLDFDRTQKEDAR